MVSWGQSTRVPTYWTDVIPRPAPPPALGSPSKGTWKRTSLTHLLSWAPKMLLGLPAPLPRLETSGRLHCFQPLEFSRTKLGLAQRALPSSKCPARGKMGRKKHFPSHCTEQYFRERHGLCPSSFPPRRRYGTLPSWRVPPEVGPRCLRTIMRRTSLEESALGFHSDPLLMALFLESSPT